MSDFNPYANTDLTSAITTKQAYTGNAGSDYSSAGSKSSGSGFGGAFSKNFGKGFLDMWTKKNFGGGGGEGDQNYFAPGSMGGGSISPIGSSKHHLFQYQPAQAQVIQHGPDAPGLGENLLTTAVGAGIGALCDIRTKVDIAPLESTEVNDSLAEIAFFVKGLRECA